MRLLRAVVVVSGIYDVLLGGALLFFLEGVRQLFGTEPPLFPIHANLNGLFALAVGFGYFAILNNLEANRWYVWIMGPLLKGGGALLFLLDFALRHSPPAFLVFAASDGLLAIITAAALLGSARRDRGDAGARSEPGT